MNREIEMAVAPAVSEQDRFATLIKSGNTFLMLGGFFLAGLVLAFTPCVLPMVPILSGIIAGQGKNVTTGRAFSLSLTYVLGMAFTYTIAGALCAAAGKQVQTVFQQPWILVLFAALFVALALSMFGLFTIQMPAAIQTRVANVSNQQAAGTFGGVALMGVLSALIVTTCVGPALVGALIVIGQTGQIARGAAALFAMSIGMGTPLLIVGASAGKLLPKAGAWMMGVKWIGGVCLAYMAFAYIRDALPKETVHRLAHPSMLYGIVATAILAIGLVLGGVHVAAERRKSPIARMSRPAKLASIVPAIAGLFMVVTWYELPPELHWETSESAAIARANQEHKPVLIDFGASWCGACKELDEKTFPDPKVQKEGARFVALHIDATDDDDAAVARVRQKYHATEGLPVVVFLDSHGQEAKRFTEFVAPDCFATALSTVQ